MVEGLSYHIVPGVHLAEDLQDGALLPTLEGQNIAVSVDGEDAMSCGHCPSKTLWRSMA